MATTRETSYEVLASVNDASTGYGFTITRCDLPDYTCRYMFGLHLPGGGAAVESHTTAAFATDGTGPIARDDEDGPSDDEVSNRAGVEGGIAFDTSGGPGSLGEHDWRL